MEYSVNFFFRLLTAIMESMEELLTTKEVARLLRLNEKKVYQLVNLGQIPHVRIAGKWLFPKREILRWIKGHTEREKDLFLAGSDDPVLVRLLRDYSQARGLESMAFYSAVGSHGGLLALKEGKVHGSCCHLLDPESGEYNLPFLKRVLPEGSYAVVTLWHRRQGLLVRKGNPLGIRNLKDVANKGARFVNRNRGTGTRLLLDMILAQEGLSPEAITGYTHEVPSHLEVGIKVFLGEGDAGIGIEYVAHLLTLDFVPLKEERFDLVLSEEVWDTKKVREFLDFLSSRVLKPVPGYSFKETGKVIMEP